MGKNMTCPSTGGLRCEEMESLLFCSFTAQPPCLWMSWQLEGTDDPVQLSVILNKIVSLFLGASPWLWQVSVFFFIPRLQSAIFKEQIWSIGYAWVHHLVNWDPHAWLQILAAMNVWAIQSGVHLSLELAGCTLSCETSMGEVGLHCLQTPAPDFLQ